jgi:hypothetical protein
MAEPVEIRCDLEREYSDVIDAVAKAKGISRTQMTLMILREWSREKVHESTLVLRLARSHGNGGAS